MDDKEEMLKDYPIVVTGKRIVLPGVLAHVDLHSNVAIAAFRAAMDEEKKLLLVSLNQRDSEQGGQEELNAYGTIGFIRQVVKLGENAYRLMVEGQYRVKLIGKNLESGEIFERYFVEPANFHAYDTSKPSSDLVVLTAYIRELLQNLLQENLKLPKEYINSVITSSDILNDIWKAVSILSIDDEKKKKLFEERDVCRLLREVAEYLELEIEMWKKSSAMRKEIKDKLEKNQKEYVLKEQLRMIHNELGEISEQDDEEDGYQSKIEKLQAKASVKKRLQKEVSKLEKLPSQSSETTVLMNYLDYMLSLPWEKTSQDNMDLKKGKKLLKTSHYGLDKVKERIIEFMAVEIFSKRKENQTHHSPIICLVGPPGTGKTSVARSVAEAMGRKYVRICLGGVRDEAEIRGHRRTYVGSKPGRLIEALIQAGVSNPLIVFDEIDKIGSDYKGDPAAALLEVLDSEQNAAFVDHYIEEPVDLSNVFFMATANDISQIPKPLQDRMEIIEINSYTTNEKVCIAKDYLLKKQRKEHGLDKGELTITPKAINRMILQYTREAGVRELERTIGTLCRKAAMGILEGEFDSLKITEKNLEKYLGKPKYREEKKEKQPQVGVVRGLAWTSVGGTTLEIQVNTMPGSGNLKLTGQLGDVMKESAEIAYSYVKRLASDYGVETTAFSEQDFHLHVPEGAVPKDGPSAGITMATAMLSAVTGKKVSSDVAMTGELTLRGNVLPIGGLKEKILAAKLCGVHQVIVPEQNKKDVEEIQEDITEGMDIFYANTMEDVLEHAVVE